MESQRTPSLARTQSSFAEIQRKRKRRERELHVWLYMFGSIYDESRTLHTTMSHSTYICLIRIHSVTHLTFECVTNSTYDNESLHIHLPYLHTFSHALDIWMRHELYIWWVTNSTYDNESLHIQLPYSHTLSHELDTWMRHELYVSWVRARYM